MGLEVFCLARDVLVVFPRTALALGSVVRQVVEMLVNIRERFAAARGNRSPSAVPPPPRVVLKGWTSEGSVCRQIAVEKKFLANFFCKWKTSVIL